MDVLSAIIIYITLLVLIIVAGIVLNSMMLMILNIHSEIRTPQTIFLKSLCISDLIYLPGGIVLIFMSAAISHDIMRYIIVMFSSFLMALNVYLVVALSLQRYISEKKFRITQVVSDIEYKYSLGITLGVWMFAIVLAIIECVLLHPKGQIWVELLLIGVPLYRLVMYAMLPIAIVTVLDMTSSRFAAAHDVPIEAMDREMNGRRMSSKLILLCFLTYPPAIFISYVVAYHLDVKYRGVVLPLGSILITSNSFFHPIVMCIANKKLSVLFKDYCCCRRRCCQQRDAPHQFNPIVNTEIPQRGDQTSETVF